MKPAMKLRKQSTKPGKIASTATVKSLFVRFSPIFSRFAAVAALLAWSVSAHPVTAGDSSVVGEVSLVLGKAWLLSEGKPRKLVEAGNQVRANDQIVTRANGHVHIRFVDQALVSVRPDSRLEIISYDYDSLRPEQSSIKFNLIEGVTRSISGEGAKAARSRYRLNTPIAAIGVRGTDFVVSVTKQSTRALVNQGAIVMAPYSDECTVSAIGPCTANAVELTDSALQVIEFEGTALVPRLIPAPHERESGTIREEVQPEQKARQIFKEPVTIREEAQPPTLADNRSQEAEAAAAAAEAEAAAAEAAAAEAEAAAAEARTTDIDPHLGNVTSLRVTEQATNDLPEFTPKEPVTSSELTSRQLVWGRWATEPSAQERITLTYNEARIGRKVTVGNTDHALFRSEGPRPQVERGLGPVSFSLDSAQAFYNADSGIVAMQVNRGNLDIDFDQSRFTTELNLNHISTGFVDFTASGSISDRGYFNAIADTQRIAGAVSQDGTEAGYFFEKQLENGSINGLTLWSAR